MLIFAVNFCFSHTLGNQVETFVKECIKTIGATWVFLPVDYVMGFKNVPEFFTFMGLKQMKALAVVGIQCVTISQEQAPHKVSIL